jgi:cell division protein ZapA
VAEKQPIAEKQSVRVTIFNQPYSLLAQGDPQEVLTAAQIVDDLMHSIAQKMSTTDSTRVAVMACLHLADKLRRREHDLTALKDRTEEIGELLDQAIDPETNGH